MYRKMWNEDMESMAPDTQKKMEEERLRNQLEYVYRTSPFYQRKFQQVNITPDEFRYLEDLSKLPFTTKAELRESQEKEPPFGDFLASSSESIVRVHRTSGATGKFLYTALTKSDLIQTNDCGARAFWAGGLRPHHTVVHCLNYCLWMGGYTDHSNLETTGATVVPFGVRNSHQLVRVIQEAKINAISTTPSYPNYLENVVREELGIEPIDLGLKLGLFGGEPALENPNFRKHVETTWGMRASNANYGMSDVLCNFASVCDDVYELHFLGQGALLAQLIEPFTEEDLSIEEGVKGELVFTNLERQAQPLVRYRTRDMIEVLGTGPCECGRTGFRFKVIGRSDDMLHVKGINVFPSGIADILNTFVPDVTGELQIVLTHPGPYDHLDIKVEHGEEVRLEEMEELRKKIEQKIKETLTYSANVELVPPNSITRTEMGKAIRVVRNFDET
jgi:phenylacetate-CoA ligase